MRSNELEVDLVDILLKTNENVTECPVPRNYQ